MEIKKMHKIISLILLLIGTTFCFSQQDTRQEVLPKKAKFDVAEAKDKLAYGTTTIKGIAIAREYTNANIDRNPVNGLLGSDVFGTKHLAQEGTTVVLFPMTDYFQEYLKMRDRYKYSKKYVPVLSKEAFSYRIEAKVGKNGEFTFDRMKPGKYYIESRVDYRGTGKGYNEVGRTDYYNGFGNYMGSDPIYQSYYYGYNDAKLETKIITIKEGESVVEIKL